ncbi:GSCFA domain-containing protein [Streptomyces nigra]|uniref:GSCFA domain-containing protein n=1 Tax=Streptomyces nigra TaxID=1827580 RepID=UPI0034552841
MASHPYTSLPERSFWRSAVAQRDPLDIADLRTPKWPIEQDAPVITTGSCFAGHIGRALLEEGMHWYNAEPPPPGLTTAQQSARGYRRFSFRTGNIYTAAALRQWTAWTLGSRTPPDEVWEEDGRFYDPYWPTVEPGGFALLEIGAAGGGRAARGRGRPRRLLPVVRDRHLPAAATRPPSPRG